MIENKIVEDLTDKLETLKDKISNLKTAVKKEDTVKKLDMVNHPPHYNFGKFEVYDVIKDWDLNFGLGNTVKYIARAGKKDPKMILQDLKKAEWYLKKEIAHLEHQEDVNYFQIALERAVQNA